MTDMTDAPNAADSAPQPARIPLVLPEAHFTDRSKVVKAVPLEYPITFAGRDWTAIHLRRLSVAQIAAVFANHSANVAVNPDARLELPIFIDEAGADLPDGLLDQIDPDDAEVVNEAVAGFMPRRFKAPTDPSPSTPETGASTSASSSE